MICLLSFTIGLISFGVAYPNGAPQCGSPKVRPHGTGIAKAGGFVIKFDDDPSELLRL